MAASAVLLGQKFCSSEKSVDEVGFSDHVTAEVRHKLANWYKVERRMMPWRGDNTTIPVTAYGVWISEVMLQQTRVETVIDYWTRWMSEFPDVATLARAAPDDVNRMWAGLGYYRRAQFLLQGARKVVSDYGGALPQTVPELLKIPGIGPYTAGAIASIAYGMREPLVDGNVMRVFSRLLAVKLEVGGGAMEKLCWKVAKDLVPDEHPGDFNQALMELGATVCKPTSPSCTTCPLRGECAALALTQLASQIDANDQHSIAKKGGLQLFVKTSTTHEIADIEVAPVLYPFDTTQLPRDVTEFPRKVAKKKAKELVFSVCVMRTKLMLHESSDESTNTGNVGEFKYLFVRRPGTGLLANQWEFPSIEMVSCEVDPEQPEDATEAPCTAPILSEAQLWFPFPAYFHSQLQLAYDGNQAQGPQEEKLVKPEGATTAATLLETASRRDFDPIVHIFSHQRHTMHITLKDIVVLKSCAGAVTPVLTSGGPVSYKWMTAAEIVSEGITTGCKKVLHEVTKPAAAAKPKKGTGGVKRVAYVVPMNEPKTENKFAAFAEAGGVQNAVGAETAAKVKTEGLNAFDLLWSASRAVGAKKARK
jgi:A/G-specific adenine glycosylase